MNPTRANRAKRRAMKRELDRENARWGPELRPVPQEHWPSSMNRVSELPIEVWRSRDFLVQVFRVTDSDLGLRRLSVTRAAFSDERAGSFGDGITWEDLERLKAECGFGDLWAVEVYPPSDKVVNVANMRHLWVLKRQLGFEWRS